MLLNLRLRKLSLKSGMKQVAEENNRRDAELKARIEELEKNKTVITKLESENAEFRDRVTKVVDIYFVTWRTDNRGITC